MNIFTLVRKEIGYRKLNFVLSVLAAAVAAVTFLGTVALLRSTDLETSRLLDEKVQETEQEMARLENDIRKSMKGLGFNIHIFPEGQDLGEVYAEGYASKTMPEEYVTRLAQSDIVTVNHLLPTLTQVTEWPEQKRKVVLIGIRGQEPKLHGGGKKQKPLMNPVADGDIVLGYELHHSLGLKVGDTIQLKGREFTVHTTHTARGTKDDITVWISLGIAQDMFDLQGRINSIMALECNCATIDRLGEIRAELGAILPGTKIIEQESKALARAEARNMSKATAMQQIASMKANRQALKEKRESLASVLIPLIGIICMGGIGLLAFLNTKDRMYEVGLLLAIGVSAPRILAVFLIKAVLGGIVGGVLGVVGALLLMSGASDLFAGYSVAALTSTGQLALVVVCVPIFTAVAAWIPAFVAAQYDPAEILRND